MKSYNFKIGKHKIGTGNKCFIIAEIGQSHDGSLGIAHSYIDAAAEIGVDAVKFQTHIAREESTKKEEFRTNFSYEDKTRFDYWKRMEFSEEEWAGLKKHCEDLNLVFLSSPFSIEAFKLLQRLNIAAWKIGSGEANNFQLLEAISKTNKPILLSTGMSNWIEIDKAIRSLEALKVDFCVFQTTSKYPTTLKDVGLNLIEEINDKYNKPVGFSDHTGLTSSSIAAIANGASLIEVHVVFDKKMFGPDSKSSLNFEELRTLVNFRDDYHEMKMNPVDKDLIAEQLITMKKLFNKSLVVKHSLLKGSILNYDNLTAKKPGIGISIENFENCIGRKIIKDLDEDHILKWSDMGEKL
jgi:N,N'-diacetyllegionaminate synthase